MQYLDDVLEGIAQERQGAAVEPTSTSTVT